MQQGTFEVMNNVKFPQIITGKAQTILEPLI